ncbi:MAG: ABC transporter ATP-binding protein, partial [Peptococcaceae bacterium]|nr:ABC transporter ATP-binding protein [Peptococcaceae bacterium]
MTEHVSELVWEDVSFSYSRDGTNLVLDRLNFCAKKGRITVVTGPSGCGKSTMLYLAAGLYPQNAGVLTAGRVLAGGMEVTALPAQQRAREIGMMFQNPDLQFCMDTVKNELIFCLENVAAPPGEMDEAAAKALAFCGVSHLKERRLAALSGGEKQKTALACVVALGPKWLVLDEPFANIDETSARDIARKLREMASGFGMGIVVADHQLEIWSEFADELAVLDGAAIAARGLAPGKPPDEVWRKHGVGQPGRPYQDGPTQKRGRPFPPILQLTQLTVCQDKEPVIKNCCADFARGRVHAIIGASGSGKSTLFEAICGFRRYGGGIRINGREMKRNRRNVSGARIGFVFQNPQDQFVAGSVLDEVLVSLRRRTPGRSAGAGANVGGSA